MGSRSDEIETGSWLTVAEFADALRVKPVTVRSWITKGQLKATRAGKRKWLIRPSELARMLDEDQSAFPPPEVYERLAALAAEDARDREAVDHAVTDYEWELSLERSRMAPPDAHFADRIRQIAQAAGRRAASIRESTKDPNFEWKPIPGSAGMTLSYELRPGGNRPGPRDAWDRFDRVVTRLGVAMEGESAAVVARALSDLASAMRDLANGLESPAPSGPPGA